MHANRQAEKLWILICIDVGKVLFLLQYQQCIAESYAKAVLHVTSK